jgi:methyl-accepting chemotaxis protein
MMKKFINLFRLKKLSSQLIAFCITFPLVISIVLTIFSASKVVDGYNKPNQTLSQTSSQSVIEKIDRNFYERFGDVQAFAFNRLAVKTLENKGAVVENYLNTNDSTYRKKVTDKNGLVLKTKQLKDSIEKATLNDDVQNFLNTMTAYYVLYDVMMIVDNNGKVIAINTLNKNGEPIKTKTLLGKDVYATEWFRVCMSAKGPEGGAWFSDFMIDKEIAEIHNNSGYGVAFAAPIKNSSGEPIGVWYNFASWAEVTQGIRAEAEQILQQKEKEAFILITNQQGKIIDHFDDKIINNRLIDSVAFSKNNFNLSLKNTKITNTNYIASFVKGRGAYTYKGKNWYAATLIPIKTLSLSTFISKDLIPLVLFVLISLIISIILSYWFSKHLSKRIIKIKNNIDELSKGNLPENNKVSYDEIGQMSRSVNNLTNNLSNVKLFSNEVGQGKFDSTIEVFNNEGELGSSLANMRNSLKEVSEDAVRRNWLNQGLAQIGEILRDTQDDSEKLYNNIVSFVVKYLNVNQGGLYIINTDGQQESTIDLVACYAFNKKKFLHKKLMIGEGLVGQCVIEKDSIYLTEVPDDYVEITSGLGQSNPRCILIVPLKVNANVHGVIELASFNVINAFEADFVKKLAESIASTISVVKINTQTKKLLEVSQQQAEEMRAQEEEMRQNMEEMQATQEETERKEQSYINEIERLKREVELLKSS